MDLSENEFDFSIAGEPVYPHIKLTRETYPRALATRIVNDDGDEYFGAFLNRTAVRILIDFLNRTFRLRTCTIAVDGSFPVPCTQYYAKRCVAPCVASLCSQDQYLEFVDLVRLFLRNDRELFMVTVSKKIERASDELDFETAVFFRDMLQEVERFWANKRWQVWLDGTVDTLELDEENGRVSVIIISQRRQWTLGTMVYRFERKPGIPSTKALADVIAQFYKHHLPREIRVSHDFDGRAAVAKSLSGRFAKKLNIVVTSDKTRRVTTERTLDRTKDKLDLEALMTTLDASEIGDELKRTFDLDSSPARIETFDAAHISATGFSAAVSVWADGKERPDEYEHWLSDKASELETLRTFVAQRLRRTSPDLVLIDGGRSHLNAALAAVSGMDKPPTVIAAVKPRGQHSSISHFLTADGGKIEFDPDRESFRLLKRLRDEAHDLANSVHRLGRDMLHFYELAAILPSLSERERQQLLREFGSIRKILRLKPEQFEARLGKRRTPRVVSEIAKARAGKSSHPQPLIVPIRYTEMDGSAEDLRPIETH